MQHRQPRPFPSCWFTAGSWMVLVAGRLQHPEEARYRVSIVQNPTLSLDDDVAVTSAYCGAAWPGDPRGPLYGGVVITQAGNDPKVAGLVYIAAFAPDKGESVATLIANPPPGAPVPPILPPQDGFLMLDSEKFAASFAADVPRTAEFMANSQVPWGVRRSRELSARPHGDRSRVGIWWQPMIG